MTTALLQVWRSGVAGDWVMFTGALLFMVSDCIIGINMFHAPVPSSQVGGTTGQEEGVTRFYCAGVDHVNIPGSTVLDHYFCVW